MNNRGTLVKVLCAVTFTLPLITGCWDRIEIEERAVVLGIGIDTVIKEELQEEEEVLHLKEGFTPPKHDMIRLTAQIAVPGRIPLGPGEGGGGGGTNGKQTVWVLNVVGHTVDDAVSNLQQKISGPLFFGHLRVIVISENYAEKGIQNLNDYFRRNPEVRRMTWLLVSKGRASAIINAAPELERVPTLYFLATLDQAVKAGKFPENVAGVFWSNLSKKGQEGFLPYVELDSKNQTIFLKGLAMFKDDNLVGTTKPLEIGLYMAIKGINPAGYQAYVEIPNHPGHFAVFEVTERKSKIDGMIQNGRPHFTVKINVEGNIREKTDEQFAITEKIINEMERTLNQNAIDSANILIRKTQEKGSDIFGFGEYVRAKIPTYWNQEIKTPVKWQEMYKDLPIDVSFQIHVRRMGMKSR
ncbi:Ger(x)C family spore germination protein [Paenibacillus tarimensis]